MTDEEIVRALQEETPFNRARRVFVGELMRLDAASSGRRGLAPLDRRRLEFEAVRRIAKELGVNV